jgi:O-antigen ligase
MTTAETLDDPPAPLTAGTGALWRERWIGVLLILSAVFTPIVSYAGQLGLAPLAALMGLFCLPLLGRRARPEPGVGILLVLVIWELISLSWSVATPLHPDFHRYKSVEGLTGIKLVLELALYGALVTCLQRIAPPVARRATLILAIGLCLMCGVMSLDALTQGGVYKALRVAFHQKDAPDLIRRNAARGCYTAALLFWPAMLRLGQSYLRVWQVALALGFFIAAIGLQVDAPVVALVVGSLVFVAVRRFGRPALWVLLAGTVLYFALTPLLIHLIFPNASPVQGAGPIVKASWFARMDLWRFAASKVPVHPLIGWGMDASRMWKDLIPLHPHNAALQIWLELGAVGAAIVILFWAWLWERIAKLHERDASAGAVAAAAAVAYLVIGGLSFGVWQEWWLGLGALTVVFCCAFAAGREGVADRPDGGELIPLDAGA